MQFILDFIDFLHSLITGLWSFFMALIEHLLLFVKYVGLALNIAYQCIASLPSWLQAFAFLTITVTVLYLLLGREGGK